MVGIIILLTMCIFCFMVVGNDISSFFCFLASSIDRGVDSSYHVRTNVSVSG